MVEINQNGQSLNAQKGPLIHRILGVRVQVSMTDKLGKNTDQQINALQ